MGSGDGEGLEADSRDRALRAALERHARSEARLIEAQRIAHVGSWEWNVASNEVTWTDEMYRIYGIGPSQFDATYEGFLQRVYPDDLDRTKSVIVDAFRTIKPFVYDHRIVRPDGSVRMLHTRGDAIADAGGKIERLAGVCWDVTELWQATQAYEQAISLLRATLESTADGLLVVGRDGRVVTHNRRLLEIWNLPPRSLDGTDFEALLASVDDQLANADACLQRVREMAAHPDAESFDSLEFWDGRFFERYSRPQRIGEAIVGRVWSYRDVSKRERLLRRSVFLADASRLLASLDVERALEALARLAVPFMGDGCAVDLFREGERRRLVSVSRDASQPIANELPHSLLAGHATLYSAGTVSCMAVPLAPRGELLGALTFAGHRARTYDESDLALAGELARRVELALENARLYQTAQEALAARDEFLAIAAHEIRGPMTSLHLAVQSLQAAPPETAARLMAIIEREDRRLARFVDELLDVTQLRSGRLRFALEAVDLADVIRHVVERLTADLDRSGSTLSVTAKARVVGSWDRARLDQVVTHLLSNAIRFGQGRPIEVRLDSDDEAATLVVRDQGIGIAPDAQARIFEPFERAVPPRHYGGLGLGLYIVRTLVTGLAGSVEVDSRPGAGATFTVKLPLARAHA